MIKQILRKNYYYFCSNSQMQTNQQINQRKPKNFPEFTHFASIPFIRKQHRETLGSFQDRIHQIFEDHKLHHTLKRSNTDLMHVTLSMFTLNLQQYRDKTVQVIKSIEKQITQILKGVTLNLGEIKYFTKYDRRYKKQNVSLFYFDITRDENTNKLEKVTNMLIRQMIKAEVIDPSELKSMRIRYDHKTGTYINEAYHLTLFRIEGLLHDQDFKEVFKKVVNIKNEKQLKISLQCDSIDVSTRFNYDETKFYKPLARVLLNQKA